MRFWEFESYKSLPWFFKILMWIVAPFVIAYGWTIGFIEGYKDKMTDNSEAE